MLLKASHQNYIDHSKEIHQQVSISSYFFINDNINIQIKIYIFSNLTTNQLIVSTLIANLAAKI